MTPQRLSRLRSVLDQRQPDLTVITDEVHKGRNLSAIVRTCDAVGIGRVHSVMPKEGYISYDGTAASAHKWVEIEHHVSVAEPLRQLRASGFQVVAAQVSEMATDFRAVDYTRPTAVLMGAEIQGVSDAAQEYIDVSVRLPMAGMVESYNVSVACAGILFEIQRQREAAGLYQCPRLPKDEYRTLFFRWAHPTIAAYCDERGLAYPPVDEEGEIIDPAGWLRSTKDNAVS